MDGYQNALSLLPPELREAYPDKSGAEELRLRRGYAPVIYDGRRERYVPFRNLTDLDLRRVLERATGASLHTASAALKRGYICYRGLRIGVCGKAIVRGGEMEGFGEFNSLAIRIPRACRGICEEYSKVINESPGGCIIFGAPGSGKTTAMRDLIFLLSTLGRRIGVADERGEISGDGEFDLGPCSDVLSGLNKAEAAMYLLRSMNPEFIAMDEISSAADGRAVREVCGCGVELLATAHARSVDELLSRPAFAELTGMGAFKYALGISGSGSERSYSFGELRT